MDRTDFLLSVLDRANELYEELSDSELLDVQDVEVTLTRLQDFTEELETLIQGVM